MKLPVIITFLCLLASVVLGLPLPVHAPDAGLATQGTPTISTVHLHSDIDTQTTSGLSVSNDLVKRGITSFLDRFSRSISKGQILPMSQQTTQQSVRFRKVRKHPNRSPLDISTPLSRARSNPHVRRPSDPRNGSLQELYYKDPLAASSQSSASARNESPNLRSKSWSTSTSEELREAGTPLDGSLAPVSFGGWAPPSRELTIYADGLAEPIASSPTTTSATDERKHVTLADLLANSPLSRSPERSPRASWANES